MTRTAQSSNLPVTIGQFHAFGILLNLVQTERYGQPYLQCFSAESGSPFGTLSAHGPDVKLDDGEVVIRTHSENEPLREPLLASGYFKDTGKRIPSGYVELEVWKRTEPLPIKVEAAPASSAVAKTGPKKK